MWDMYVNAVLLMPLFVIVCSALNMFLLPEGTKLLPERMLYHQQGPLAFKSG